MPGPSIRPQNIAEFAERFGLYLAYALRGQIELPGDTLKGAVSIVCQPESGSQHELLGLLQQPHGCFQVLALTVEMQVPVRLLVFGGCHAVKEGQGFAVSCGVGGVSLIAHVVQQELRRAAQGSRGRSLSGNPPRLGIASGGAGFGLTLQRSPDVHRHAHCPGLGHECQLDRLTYPPFRIRGEAVTALGIEFLQRPQQPDVAFLDEIQQRQAPVAIGAGDHDNEPELMLDELPPRVVVSVASAARQTIFLAAREALAVCDLAQVAAHDVVATRDGSDPRWSGGSMRSQWRPLAVAAAIREVIELQGAAEVRLGEPEQLLGNGGYDACAHPGFLAEAA